MSMRTIARSSSKRNSASALASSVFPTPVGPRNRNEPDGRSGSAMPALDLRTASETACTAAAWPVRGGPSPSSVPLRLSLKGGDLPVHQPGRGLEVSVPLGPLGLPAQVIQLLLQLADLVQS